MAAPSRIASSLAQTTHRESGAPGLNPRLELGQAKTSSFIGVVVALHRVRKGGELLCLDVRKELDVQGALPISIEPPLAGWLAELFGGRAEQSPQLVLTLSGEPYRRLARRSGSRRRGSRIGCSFRRFWGAGFGAFDGCCLGRGNRPRGRHVSALRRGWRGEGTGKVVFHGAGLLTSRSTQQRETHRDTQDRSDPHFVFPVGD